MLKKDVSDLVKQKLDISIQNIVITNLKLCNHQDDVEQAIKRAFQYRETEIRDYAFSLLQDKDKIEMNYILDLLDSYKSQFKTVVRHFDIQLEKF